MNKRFLYTIGICLLCTIHSPQAAAELKIGFVSALKLMDTAPQVEKANKRLEQEFAPRQRRLASAQQEIKKLEDRLAKEGNIMRDSEADTLSRDVREKKRDWKRQQDEFQEDYNIRRSEELNKLQKQIIEVIQAIAKEQAYDVILNEGGVVWAGGRVDITDQVLKRLNQQNH